MKSIAHFLAQICFILCLNTETSAQEKLTRKPWFGAQFDFTDEGRQTGCKITRVAGGTSKVLGLQKDDQVIQIGDMPLNSYKELPDKFKNFKLNDAIELKVIRNNKKIKLRSKVAGRPFETDDNAEVIYDQAAYKNGQLRVIINRPKKDGRMPAMLFIPGYTCSSIDNLTFDHPYKRILDAYVDAGYVTLRIEKSGLGDSKNTPACESCDLMDEIENFEVGLKKLKALPFVDTNQIIIYGHSMGGIVAPAISSRNKVAGVVVFGTTAKSWFEYQIEMHRLQSGLSTMNPIEVEEFVLAQYDLNYRYFIKKEKLEDLAKDPKADSILRAVWAYDGKGKIYDRNAEYWRQIQDYPHLENWKNTSAKVLVQFGESDFQAFSKADHQQIVNTVNHFHPGNAQLQTYPLTDHFFARSGTMQEAYDKFGKGQIQQLFDEYNPQVGLTAVAWSNEVLGKKDSSLKLYRGWQKLKTEKYPGKQDDIVFITETEVRPGKNNWRKKAHFSDA